MKIPGAPQLAALDNSKSSCVGDRQKGDWGEMVERVGMAGASGPQAMSAMGGNELSS